LVTIPVARCPLQPLRLPACEKRGKLEGEKRQTSTAPLDDPFQGPRADLFSNKGGGLGSAGLPVARFGIRPLRITE